MEINNDSLDAFRKDFYKIVQSLEEKYNVSITLGRITYEEDLFTTKMTVTNARDRETIARIRFDSDVWHYEHLGLGKGMYNRIFIGADGEKYAIQGFNTRSRKYPLNFLRLRDNSYRKGNERFFKELTDDYYTEIRVLN